ncbi:hypothetical protein ACIRBZ_23235 [Streptomyces sp. NPDC094038]|uniref:hypothetical protein n=1 Tax=Streptomyces sp. NPDC094038 TaxID=3366055 RepID=UPI003814BDB7
MRNPSGQAAALSAVTVVLFAAAAGCGGGPGHAAPAPATSSPAAATSAPAPATGRPTPVTMAWDDTVTKAPAFPDGEVVAQAANATGGREMDIKGGVGDGILAVLVNCEGKGELTVTVEPIGFDFPFDCADGRVSTIDDETNLNGGAVRPHTPGTVQVTASAGVRWAITVGHQDVSGRPDSW